MRLASSLALGAVRLALGLTRLADRVAELHAGPKLASRAAHARGRARRERSARRDAGLALDLALGAVRLALGLTRLAELHAGPKLASRAAHARARARRERGAGLTESAACQLAMNPTVRSDAKVGHFLAGLRGVWHPSLRAHKLAPSLRPRLPRKEPTEKPSTRDAVYL